MEGDEEKRSQVREFLSALSPSELRRVVEFFRGQMGLPALEENEQPVIMKSGIERTPPNAIAAENGK